MEFSFRGPPEFWELITELAEKARRGETAFMGSRMANDPKATSDWRITFIGDPVGDGIGMIFIDDDDGEKDATPWLEMSDRVAARPDE